jgi:hypothetical protein
MEYIIERFLGQSIVYMRRTGAYGAPNYALMAALKDWGLKTKVCLKAA